MDDLPHILTVELWIGTDGSTGLKSSNLELKLRERDLFLTTPSRIYLRGTLYEKLAYSDIARLNSEGNPYKEIRYMRYH